MNKASIIRFLTKQGLMFPLPVRLYNWLRFFMFWRGRLSLGVRVLAYDDEGRIFLVKHSYLKKWYLPGGGVDRGETPDDAAKRELLEEADICAQSAPILHDFFLVNSGPIDDYVASYIVKDWGWNSADGLRPESAASDDGEIIARDFFSLDLLPEDIAPSSLRQIERAKQMGYPFKSDYSVE